MDTSFLLKFNGAEQCLEIKGVLRTNPVLLFIHRRPSWPATPMIRKFNHYLTKYIVLYCWHKRNCRKSKTDGAAKLSPDLYVDHARQVSLYYKKRISH
jgi:hypothetical protein